VVDESFETESSLIWYGRRHGDPVVLKVVKVPGDEWRCGEVVSAFRGRGMVRALEHVDGAALFERIVPGAELVELTRCGHDDDATVVLADVIAAMSPGAAPAWCATVADWGRAFGRYVECGDTQIPLGAVRRAGAVFGELCETQAQTRLLHGDLHHYNILDGGTRGWVSIDPKGVIGEVEYELGAALRNPVECPEILGNPATIEKRIDVMASRLGLDADRVLRWAYAQAVLSAIWLVEDGYTLAPTDASSTLARTLETILLA
jgi:streptomycin 6-kinase